MPRRFRLWDVCFLLAAFMATQAARADPVPVMIDTSLIAGQSAILVFDFIDGGPPGNTVAISSFASDAALGAVSTIGDVTGVLPGQVTLADTGFFNEYAQQVLLGNGLSFTFNATGNVPDAGAFPDSFSVFLIDPTTGLSLVTTSDPTGANALLLFSIGNPEPLAVYESAQVTVVAAVPEPGGLSLLLAAALALVCAHRFRLPQAKARRTHR